MATEFYVITLKQKFQHSTKLKLDDRPWRNTSSSTEIILKGLVQLCPSSYWTSPPLPTLAMHTVTVKLRVWQSSGFPSWSPAEHVFNILTVFLYFGLFCLPSRLCSFLLNPILFLKCYAQQRTMTKKLKDKHHSFSQNWSWSRAAALFVLQNPFHISRFVSIKLSLVLNSLLNYNYFLFVLLFFLMKHPITICKTRWKWKRLRNFMRLLGHEGGI